MKWEMAVILVKLASTKYMLLGDFVTLCPTMVDMG